jgi:ubiquinone/menaquinone biosynthesis C-methylase UbiE
MGVHCMVHSTNFAVQTLSHLAMVKRTKSLLSTFYNYFYKSPKRHLEFTKLAKIMETRGFKILKNIKT